ncbi:heavy metal translocating P-type ATPase [Pseudomonas sp. Pseusp122]|uniref:heavy metal translocating P-type ATPase n=1 Tax=unclassified Pseudomonas TaxID=196821 RepID=UPI0039A4D62F
MNRGIFDPVLLALCLGVLVAGVILDALEYSALAHGVWASVSVLIGLILAAEVLINLARGMVGVDLTALLSILGALYFSQFLVAAVVCVMLASGRTLEYFSSHRAERELKHLIQRAPTFAWTIDGEQLFHTPLAQIVPGQRILVRMGDVIPLDGQLLDTCATVDESALTGEPMPVQYACTAELRSGAVNVGPAFSLTVTRSAEQSTYAGIVKMAQTAQHSRAPFVRAADRYALLLVPVTLLLAAGAWLWTHDPLRALAVVVVSTPCPLILAVPIAILSGISRCARRGILVKDGATLEAMAKTRILMLDKTGTLTTGHASVQRVETVGDITGERLLYLAGSLAQGSPHPVSGAIVEAARRRSPTLPLAIPTQLQEHPGAGICGVIEGYEVRLGSLTFVTRENDPWATGLLARLDYQGLGASFIAMNARVCGAILFSDPPRVESASVLRRIRRMGVEKIVMLTGDRLASALWVATSAGVEDVRADLSPQDKVKAVQDSCALGITMMIGDGINDAPALAAADIGVAMGANGASAASEAAGVVLLLDRLDRVAQALEISKRSCAIARQSMLIGMSLSFIAMLAAAAGYLAPLMGAILQELIDVGVILNALRALSSPGWRRLPAVASEQLQQLAAEHLNLMQVLEQLGALARDFHHLSPEQAKTRLRALIDRVEQQLLPHERNDESRLYPQLLAYLHGDDPLAALSHTHREIFRLVGLLKHLNEGLCSNPPTITLDEVHDALIRLDALVALHFAQEEELYRSLDQQ